MRSGQPIVDWTGGGGYPDRESWIPHFPISISDSFQLLILDTDQMQLHLISSINTRRKQCRILRASDGSSIVSSLNLKGAVNWGHGLSEESIISRTTELHLFVFRAFPR